MKPSQKKDIHIIGLLLLIFAAVQVGCMKGSTQEPVVAKVNDFKITEERFKDRLANLCYLQGIGSLSKDDRKRLLEQEIERQLLINEAMHLGLDREEAFRKTIQNFWEQTLITNLLREKTNEFQNKVIVTSEEVKERYDQLKKEQGLDEPFDEQKAIIEKNLLQEKKEKILYDWIQELREKARIEINENTLNSMR